MAKKSSWHFYTFIIAFSAILVVHVLWTYTPIKNEVKATIIERLQPYLGESFIINDFEVGVNSITFYKIRATNKAATFTLDLRKIRIGFNLYQLLINGLDPFKTITSVTFINPRLNLYSGGKLPERRSPGLTPEEIMEEILLNIEKFPEIDFITVANGEIYWMSPEDNIPLLSRLGGRINYVTNRKEVNLDLRGKFLGVEQSSLNLYGNLNFEDQNWGAKLLLDDCEVTSDLPFWRFNWWEIDHARLFGGILIENPNYSLDSLRFSGNVEIADLTTRFWKQEAEASLANVRFENRGLIIEPFEARIEQGRGRFGGEIKDLLDPHVDWTLEIEDYDAADLKKSHNVFEFAYEGKIHGVGKFSGPLKQMVIDADLAAPNLLYSVVPFNTCKARFRYHTKPKQMDFEYLRADFYKWRTQGVGDINFKDFSIRLDLNSDIWVPTGYFNYLTGLNEGTIKLDTDFQGDFTSRFFYGDFKWSANSLDETLAYGSGPFTLDDQLFKFNIKSDNLPTPVRMSGVFEQIFSEPLIRIMNVRDFPVKEFTFNPLIANAVEGTHFDFYFAGPYELLQAKVKVQSEDRITDLVTGTANIHDIFTYDQRYKGRFKAHTAPESLDGRFDVAFSRNGMNTEIHVPGVVRTNFYMGAGWDDPFRGTATLKRNAVQHYLAKAPGLEQLFQQGFLSGEMTFAGTVGNPSIDFNLNADEFILNSVGYYNGRFSGNLADYQLDFADLKVELNGDDVLVADLTIDLEDEKIDLVMQADSIESNFLAETIFQDRDIVRGEFDYLLKASGPLYEPKVIADIQMREGVFSGVPFERVEGSFKDSLKQDGYFWNIQDHVINIPNFLYHNYHQYTLRANGMLSVDPDGPLNMRCNLDGNVLAEVPKLDPYFMNPESDGQLFVHVKGSRTNPYFEEVQLDIVDGSLEFDGVIPPLHDIRAKVELTGASNLVDIKWIEGRLEDRWVKMYNRRPEEVNPTGLQPWLFSEVGLDFGVLLFETDERGIPLSIPDLMKEGEKGYFAVYGRESDETFLMSGPPESPFARGRIKMYDCRITFPFEGMYEEGYDYETGSFDYDYDEYPVMGFMVNLYTEVLMEPGNNNRYFVEIPAYVGEVAMDLNIDNSSPGLEFRGRFIEESWRVIGGMESSRGRVEYLDVQFKVERFGAEFNQMEILPEVYGQAFTTIRDSTGDFPRDIFLRLFVVDPITGKEVSKGRWEDFRFKLVSRNPVIGETQEQVLSYLGYSVDNLQYKAREVGLTMTENFLIRPLFRPLERQLERRLRLDYVRLRSNFASNLFYASIKNQAEFFNNAAYFNPSVNNQLDPTLLLLQSSEVTLGKYLLRDFYLTYTGELVTAYEQADMGLNHTIGLEYRVLYNLLLEVEYNDFILSPFYTADEILQFGPEGYRDWRIRLRHSFNF